MILYEVRDWQRHYTVSQNRRTGSGPLPWVAMRTKHDGKGFRRVMRLQDAMALMGAWMLIVEVAAKCPVHGKLEDADGPLTAMDLADKTGGDQLVFERALQVFASQEIAWLTRTALGALSDSSALTVCDGTVRDGTVRDGTKSKNPTSARVDARQSGSESGFCSDSMLTKASLRDPDAVDRWLSHETGGDLCECNRGKPANQRRPRSDAIVDGSDGTRFNVQAAAAKATTAKGIREPLGVFKWLVKGRHWDFLRCADDEFVKKLRREASTASPDLLPFLADFGKVPA